MNTDLQRYQSWSNNPQRKGVPKNEFSSKMSNVSAKVHNEYEKSVVNQHFGESLNNRMRGVNNTQMIQYNQLSTQVR